MFFLQNHASGHRSCILPLDLTSTPSYQILIISCIDVLTLSVWRLGILKSPSCYLFSPHGDMVSNAYDAMFILRTSFWNNKANCIYCVCVCMFLYKLFYCILIIRRRLYTTKTSLVHDMIRFHQVEHNNFQQILS